MNAPGGAERARDATAAIEVETGARGFEDARKIGRGRLRALIGLVAVRTQLMFGAELFNEGWIQPIDGSMLRDISVGHEAMHVVLLDEHRTEVEQALTGFDLERTPLHHLRALQWVAEALVAAPLAVQLTSLWFAVVSLVDGSFTRAELRRSEFDDQMDRAKFVVRGLPLGTARQNQLIGNLDRAYRLRNRVVHQGEWEAVQAEHVEQLWLAVKELLMTVLAMSRPPRA